MFEALKNEAVKRGFKEGVYIQFKDIKTIVLLKNNEYNYYEEDNSLCVGGYEVFLNGVWHEIIQTITKEEAEKQLGRKII